MPGKEWCPSGPPVSLEDLVEEICREFDHYPRTRVRQLVHDVAREFTGASVTAFVPIFVKRQTRTRLRSGSFPATPSPENRAPFSSSGKGSSRS